MAASVEVLCPSGHRQKVKITPNTKILQVLEEVCTKKGFLPAEEYELRHGRKSLDVTLTVRFAGLPNHAKLELVKSQKARADSEVVVALQMESGRQQHTFCPNTTLWTVVQHFQQHQDSQPVGHHPVITYMREEVIGEYALRETSLRALGLTGGRALFRFSYREIDQNVLTAIRDKIEKEKARQEKLQAKSNSNTDISKPSGKTMSQDQLQRNSSKTEVVAMETDSDPSVAGSFNQPALDSVPMDAEVTSSSDEPMEQIVTRGAQAAREGRSVGQEVMRDQRREDSLRELERLPGVEVIRPGDFDNLTEAEQNEARQMAANVFPSIFPPDAPRSARPKVTHTQQPYQPPAPNPFANFKFPEATKGQNLYKNELSEVRPEEFQPCEREVAIYSLDEIQPNTGSAAVNTDVPDDFFDVTVNDVQRMYADLQKAVATFGEQPLMTSAMRQQAAEERMSRYPRVILRIQFPDRLVLQGVFRPRETVFALQKFVKEHLADKDLPFYLYTSPPKCVLKDRSATLYEANLVPMTVVYFGCEVTKEHFLSDMALCQVDPRAKAGRVVYRHMTEKTGEGTSSTLHGSGSQSRPKRNNPSTASGSSTSEPKVPKWFKVGKK